MVKTQKSVPAVKSRLNLSPGKSKSLPGSTFQVNRHSGMIQLLFALQAPREA